MCVCVRVCLCVFAKSASLPIWITDSFRPARARLVDGMAELLLGIDIVRKLDIALVFGSNQFRIGQWGSEMMTYNGKHRWVFHLVSTACAFDKLDDYFSGSAKSANRSFASAGGFRGAIWKFGK